MNTLASPSTTITPGLDETTLLKVWPNPSHDLVNFAWGETLQQGSLTVLDLQGKTVIRKQGISGQKFALSVQGLSPGMYMYGLEEGGNVLGVGKIIVE